MRGECKMKFIFMFNQIVTFVSIMIGVSWLVYGIYYNIKLNKKIKDLWKDENIWSDEDEEIC